MFWNVAQVHAAIELKVEPSRPPCIWLKLGLNALTIANSKAYVQDFESYLPRTGTNCCYRKLQYIFFGLKWGHCRVAQSLGSGNYKTKDEVFVRWHEG